MEKSFNSERSDDTPGGRSAKNRREETKKPPIASGRPSNLAPAKTEEQKKKEEMVRKRKEDDKKKKEDMEKKKKADLDKKKQDAAAARAARTAGTKGNTPKQTESKFPYSPTTLDGSSTNINETKEERKATTKESSSSVNKEDTPLVSEASEEAKIPTQSDEMIAERLEIPQMDDMGSSDRADDQLLMDEPGDEDMREIEELANEIDP